jgi:rhodanese-related sulfurtransferase
VSSQELKDWMATGKQFTLIDVREDHEWRTGHAATALHITRGTLSDRISSAAPDKAAAIVLYCKGGVRSAASAATLQKLGYTNVHSLIGGFLKYQLAGLPVQY